MPCPQGAISNSAKPLRARSKALSIKSSASCRISAEDCCTRATPLRVLPRNRVRSLRPGPDANNNAAQHPIPMPIMNTDAFFISTLPKSLSFRPSQDLRCMFDPQSFVPGPPRNPASRLIRCSSAGGQSGAPGSPLPSVAALFGRATLLGRAIGCRFATQPVKKPLPQGAMPNSRNEIRDRKYNCSEGRKEGICV